MSLRRRHRHAGVRQAGFGYIVHCNVFDRSNGLVKPERSRLTPAPVMPPTAVTCIRSCATTPTVGTTGVCVDPDASKPPTGHPLPNGPLWSARPLIGQAEHTVQTASSPVSRRVPIRNR